MSVLEHSGRTPASGDAPVAPPRVSASGPSPYRILLVGSDIAAGVGVTSHELALSGCIARSLGGALGHGVDVEALVLRAAGLAAYEDSLRDRFLAHLDGVLLLLEKDQAEMSADGLRQLLDGLTGRIAPTAMLLVVTAPGCSAERRAAVHSAARGVAEVVDLDEDPSASRSPAERYLAWAEDVAQPLVSGLKAPLLWDGDVEPIDERTRLRAVRDAGLGVTADVAQALRRIVDLASTAYRTRSAAISLIDGTTARYIASRHLADRERLRQASLCDTAMQAFGGLIVSDASQDERFQDLDAVRSGDTTFYAGHRIVSPDGLPIGALCVFDPAPRPVAEQDLVLLRDLAHLAEEELWRAWPARDTAPDADGVDPAGTAQG